MDERALIVPRRAISDLEKLFIPEETSFDSKLCLSINIENSDVNIREFAGYLDIIDNIYGRLTKHGINAYAMRIEDQLKIHKIKYGSQEIQLV